MIWDVSSLHLFGSYHLHADMFIRSIIHAVASYQAWWNSKYFQLKDANIFTFTFIRNLIWTSQRRPHNFIVLRVTWVPTDWCSPPSSHRSTRTKGCPGLWCSWQKHYPILKTIRTSLISFIHSYMLPLSPQVFNTHRLAFIGTSNERSFDQNISNFAPDATHILYYSITSGNHCILHIFPIIFFLIGIVISNREGILFILCTSLPLNTWLMSYR